jgi:hypothetical protein
MAKKVDGISQSGFIREHLNADRDVKYRVVADAWKTAGNPGEIKSSLFYLVKNKMGLAKGKPAKKLGRPRKATGAVASVVASPAPIENDAAVTYREIEGTLDTLVHQAMELRNLQLAESLLAARRRASIQLV